ncbi:hypothetical protein [Pseudomonas viridiflava]|uniref:hypothetical protein n=1 Tax=Pseudomonas viridiflava TaxID=33069 RepID=UPI000F012BE8|nr:hypothetical protein [Pseudomonas viridiflava]
MEHGEVKQREASIVIVGDFDPLMMAPHWFVKNGMIPQEDVDDNLSIDIVYKEATRFSLASIVVEILVDRVILRSYLSSFDYKIHDLAVGILSLPAFKNTKVSGVGLNVFHDVSVTDDEVFHRLGDRLAPKDIWLNSMPDIDRAGLWQLQVQLVKASNVPGVYNFTAVRSEIKNGLRFSLNNHFDDVNFRGELKKSPTKKPKGSHVFDAVALVSAYWQETLDVHVHVIDSLLNNIAQEI